MTNYIPWFYMDVIIIHALIPKLVANIVIIIIQENAFENDHFIQASMG